MALQSSLTDTWGDASGALPPGSFRDLKERAKSDSRAMADLQYFAPRAASDLRARLKEAGNGRGINDLDPYASMPDFNGNTDENDNGIPDDEENEGNNKGSTPRYWGTEEQQLSQWGWDRDSDYFAGMWMRQGDIRATRFYMLNHQDEVRQYGIESGLFKDEVAATKFFENERTISSIEEWQRDHRGQALSPGQRALIDRLKAENKPIHDAIEQHFVEKLGLARGEGDASVQTNATLRASATATPSSGEPNDPLTPSTPANAITANFNATASGTGTTPAPDRPEAASQQATLRAPGPAAPAPV